MSVVSRDNPVALWRQLKEEIRSMIADGLQPGDQIPGENELCERHGLSRTVVRHAIDSLVNEGMLFRRQGRGTFVAPAKAEQNVVGWRTEDGQYRTSMAATDAVVVGSWEGRPGGAVKEHLHVEDRDVIYQLRRVRLTDGEPIAEQFDAVPRRFCPGLLSDQGGLVRMGRTIAEKFGLRAAFISISVECVTADAEVARLLGVADAAPLMVVHRVFSLASGEPFRYCRTRFRHDRLALKFPTFRIADPDLSVSLAQQRST